MYLIRRQKLQIIGRIGDDVTIRVARVVGIHSSIETKTEDTGVPQYANDHLAIILVLFTREHGLKKRVFRVRSDECYWKTDEC